MGHNEISAKRKIHSTKCTDIKKLEGFYTNNLTAQLNTLEQNEANTQKRSKRKEIINLRTKNNQIKTKRMIQRIDKTKCSFFEKINKIEKLLAKLIKGHRYSI